MRSATPRPADRLRSIATGQMTRFASASATLGRGLQRSISRVCSIAFTVWTEGGAAHKAEAALASQLRKALLSCTAAGLRLRVQLGRAVHLRSYCRYLVFQVRLNALLAHQSYNISRPNQSIH